SNRLTVHLRKIWKILVATSCYVDIVGSYYETEESASIVNRYRSRWNSGASVEATVTQEKRTKLNGQRRPNHQTFFLHIPTRSGSTSGRTGSLMSRARPRAYLAGPIPRLIEPTGSGVLLAIRTGSFSICST